MIIEADTRQRQEKHITDYFDKENIKWIKIRKRKFNSTTRAISFKMSIYGNNFKSRNSFNK